MYTEKLRCNNISTPRPASPRRVGASAPPPGLASPLRGESILPRVPGKSGLLAETGKVISQSCLKSIMALTDEQKQRIREEEIERIRVRRELSSGDARKTVIFWCVLIAVAFLLWTVVKGSHNH
jgi:hypothetical protein